MTPSSWLGDPLLLAGRALSIFIALKVVAGPSVLK